MALFEGQLTPPGTALSAVNEMLRAVGRTSVASLETADMDEYSQEAVQVLTVTSREIQSHGWAFNTEVDVTLSPSTLDGSIALPNNTMRFSANPRSLYRNIAMRNGKLYNRETKSYVFEKPVRVDYVLLYPFEELSEPFRNWITIRAIRKFATGRIPDSLTFRLTSADETAAKAAAEYADGQEEGSNLKDHSPHFAGFRRR